MTKSRAEGSNRPLTPAQQRAARLLSSEAVAIGRYAYWIAKPYALRSGIIRSMDVDGNCIVQTSCNLDPRCPPDEHLGCKPLLHSHWALHPLQLIGESS